MFKAISGLSGPPAVTNVKEDLTGSPALRLDCNVDCLLQTDRREGHDFYGDGLRSSVVVGRE